jgi:hypothetical protein
LLIKWSNLPDEDASWEDYDVIARHYLSFILEDKNNFEGRGLSGDEDETQTIRDEDELQGRSVGSDNGQEN